MLLLQQNIYDKFSALRGESENDLVFWRVLTWGMAAVLIIVGCWLIYQRLMRKLAVDSDPRAQLSAAKKRNIDLDGQPKIESLEPLGPRNYVTEKEADVYPALAKIAVGTRVALFWNVGELRCGSIGLSAGEQGGRLLAGFETESVPEKGSATLLCPEASGHVLYYRVEIHSAGHGLERSLALGGPKPVSRVHHRYRSSVNLRAAALRTDAAEQSEEGILLRVQDLAFDGFGVLSEEALIVGENLSLRIPLPEYLEPLRLQGRVAWAEVDATGFWRGGIELAHDNIEQRLALADYLLANIRAQSGEIILEQRRRQHTPVKPIPVEPGT